MEENYKFFSLIWCHIKSIRHTILSDVTYLWGQHLLHVQHIKCIQGTVDIKFSQSTSNSIANLFTPMSHTLAIHMFFLFWYDLYICRVIRPYVTLRKDFYFRIRVKQMKPWHDHSDNGLGMWVFAVEICHNRRHPQRRRHAVWNAYHSLEPITMMTCAGTVHLGFELGHSTFCLTLSFEWCRKHE